MANSTAHKHCRVWLWAMPFIYEIQNYSCIQLFCVLSQWKFSNLFSLWPFRYYYCVAVKTGLIFSFYAVCLLACLQFCNFLNGAYCLFTSNLCIATWIKLMCACNLLPHFLFSISLHFLPESSASAFLICSFAKWCEGASHISCMCYYDYFSPWLKQMMLIMIMQMQMQHTFTNIWVQIWWNSKFYIWYTF